MMLIVFLDQGLCLSISLCLLVLSVAQHSMQRCEPPATRDPSRKRPLDGLRPRSIPSAILSQRNVQSCAVAKIPHRSPTGVLSPISPTPSHCVESSGHHASSDQGISSAQSRLILRSGGPRRLYQTHLDSNVAGARGRDTRACEKLEKDDKDVPTPWS